MLILDTDHMTVLQWANNEETQRLRSRLEQVLEEEWTTTIITFEEQSRGWLAYVKDARTVSRQVEAYAKLASHLDNYRSLTVLGFDAAAAAEYERLATRLKLRIGVKDLQIAAIVLARQGILLTRNRKHFGKVPDLRFEDWTR